VADEIFQKVSEELQEQMIKRILTTRIQCTFSLEEVQHALELYIRNMSAGKILFQP